jgi:hypothetical protein
MFPTRDFYDLSSSQHVIYYCIAQYGSCSGCIIPECVQWVMIVAECFKACILQVLSCLTITNLDGT